MYFILTLVYYECYTCPFLLVYVCILSFIDSFQIKICFTPLNSRNTAKDDVKHQSINLLILYRYARPFKLLQWNAKLMKTSMMNPFYISILPKVYESIGKTLEESSGNVSDPFFDQNQIL